MEVCVAVDLSVGPQGKHVEDMRRIARYLTHDKKSVRVSCPSDAPKQIVAVFTIPKARQIDVVDRIGREFWDVKDYQTSTIWFPQRTRRARRK